MKIRRGTRPSRVAAAENSGSRRRDSAHFRLGVTVLHVQSM